MSFLGRSEIQSRGTAIFDKQFEPSNLQQASIDLRLGKEYYVAGAKSPNALSEKKPFIKLAPGQFAILTSAERLEVQPDTLGFITLRNRYKMQGLVNISGFHVDPTYKGILKFAVQNVGPSDIRLRLGEPTFTIFFARVEGDIGEPRKGEVTNISLEDASQLGGSSFTLAQLKKEVERLRFMLLVYAPFAIAALLALLMNLLRNSSTSPK